MDDDLCDIIASIIQEKIETKRLPVHAMFMEITKRYNSKDLREELEALEALDLILSGNTINDTFYLIND